jgi:glycosyltransferase involved in cell wall biosynthesis
LKAALSYPRVLIVTSSTFNPFTGTGISLLNLFKGWPKERLANLHREPGLPDTSVCERFYYLAEREMAWRFPVSAIAGAIRKVSRLRNSGGGPGRPPAGPSVPAGGAATGNGDIPLSRVLPQRLVDLGVKQGLIDWRTEARLTSELRAWIEDFRPQLVYTSLGDLGFLKLVRLIREGYGVPTVIQMADDWPEGRYRGLVSRWLRGEMERELRRALGGASLRFGICDAMCRAYEQRYALPFRSCISPVETEEWLPFAKTDWSYAGSFRVVYMGTVHPLAQLQSLADVARAISEMHQAGIAIHFEIYTPEAFVGELRRKFRGLAGIRVTQSPTTSQAPPVLGGADLLVIPVNFDRSSFQYIKYSLPAKAIAYMISSCPVLLYGPANVPPVEYARSEGWGFVVDTRGPAGMKEAIRALMGDEALRKKLGSRGREVATRDHDAKRLRAWFHDALCRIAPATAG